MTTCVINTLAFTLFFVVPLVPIVWAAFQRLVKAIETIDERQ